MIKWKLRQVMHEKEMNCVVLAEKVGLHPETVRKHQRKKEFKGMQCGVVRWYCEALDCHPGDLLERV